MRLRSAWLTVCSALVLAGCGGGSDNTFTLRQTTTTPRLPKIQSAVATQLATRSEVVAQRLDAGDSCGAAEEAAQLRNELTAAINARAIPGLYQEDLSASVNELQASISCTPPSDENGEGDGHGKKKKDKHDHGDHE
jgi:uncharacterized lipoprotein YmbA